MVNSQTDAKDTTSSSQPTEKTTTSTTIPSTAATTKLPSTPKPTSTPSETIWTVKYDNGSACIMMEAHVELKVTYDFNNKTKNTTVIELPHDVKVSGSCGGNSSSQLLKLEWNKSENVTDYVTFTFNKTDSSYYINEIDISVELEVQDGNKTVNQSAVLNYSGKLFSTSETNSFTCANPDAIHLNSSTLNATAALNLHTLQYEAYVTNKNSTFSSSLDCITQELTPDIVPILVAGALILLVVIVLLAYVVTRHMTQASGYVSM